MHRVNADPSTLVTRMLLGEAHGMRNDIATLRSVVQITDDAEIRDALRDASTGLQITIERVVTAAKLGEQDAIARSPIELRSIVNLAHKRWKRECGGQHEIEVVWSSVAEVELDAPAMILERLIVDLMHVAGTRITISAAAGVTQFVADAGDVGVLSDYLAALADVCGAQLDSTVTGLRLVIPS